jgi:hypothetical protein
MNKQKNRLLMMTVALVAHVVAMAQIELKDIMRAGSADGGKYLETYLAPAVISFNNGMSSGWYNTAKNHKLFGVDFTVAVNLAAIPDDMKSFDFNSVNWQVLQLQPGDNNMLPTLAGGNTDSGLFIDAQAQVEGQTYQERIDFTAASGVGTLPMSAVPTPTVTMGIGLFKNTDLKIRYMPTVGNNDFEIGLFGIGVMHDIKQWIPGLKLMPFDLAGFVGTTSLKTKLFISDVNEPDFQVENGLIDMKIATTTVQVLISKQLSVFTPYAGVGYSFSSSTLDVNGTYTYDDGVSTATVVRDPISLDFSEGNTPRVTVGARLKFVVLTLHADYTFQKYNTFSAGIGLSVR